MPQPRTFGRAGVAASLVSVSVMVALAGIGPSAMSVEPPPPGPARSLGVEVGRGVATGLLGLALLVGALGVGLAWAALRRGWAPRPGRLVATGIGSAVALVLVPPMGSTDIGIYAAYGRMVVLGLNPYLDTVHNLVHRGDPIGLAYSGAWAGTSSVYGPVALVVQALAAWLGGGSARLIVWLLQIAACAAFVATALLLDRQAAAWGGTAARCRVALLWTLNPLFLFEMVNAGHVDVFAVLLGVSALLVVRRSSLGSGALVALAVGVKVSYGLYVVAIAWALRRDRNSLLRYLTAGALTGVLVFTPVWPEFLDPLGKASGFVAKESPWHPLLVALEGHLAAGLLHALLRLGSILLLALVVWRAGPALPKATEDDARSRALWTAALLSLAWLLTSTYALPWYDVIAWAPLVLLPASGLDLVLLVRLAVTAIGYLPGSAEDGGTAGWVMPWLRGVVTPTVSLALLAVVLLAGPRLRLRPPAESPTA